MLAKNEFKFPIDSVKIKIPSDILGLDVGYSLLKIVYKKENDLVFSIMDTASGINEIENLVYSLPITLKGIHLTGGKSFHLSHQFKNKFATNLINEFEANSRGISFLYSLQRGKSLPSSIIVTVGTGTSIVLKDEEIKHLGGSALGGEFFMGMARLLCHLDDYGKAINLANSGNRYNVDLKVGDIYEKGDNRVDILFREFTAASFGKINLRAKFELIAKEDMLSSINAMLAENIGTIATLFADKHDISTILFSGGFLINNKAFKRIVSLLCKINNKNAIILDHTEFAGALGALFYLRKS